MPEKVASDGWCYDYCPGYNLDKDIINTYLNSIWGDRMYFVEVSRASWRDMFRDDYLTSYSAAAMTSDSGCHASSQGWVETWMISIKCA